MATLQPADSEFPTYPPSGVTPPPILAAPIAVDPIIKTMVDNRLAADGSILEALLDLRRNLQSAPSHDRKVYPGKLRGQFLSKNGAPLGGILVTSYPPDPPPAAPAPVTFDATAWVPYSDLTDDRGVFNVTLPALPFPDNTYPTVVRLRLLGADGVATDVSLSRLRIQSGDIGVYLLDPSSPDLHRLSPSTIEELKDIFPTGLGDSALNTRDFASTRPPLSLGGEDGDCEVKFRSNSGVLDAFPFSVAFRLSTPSVSPQRLVLKGAAATAGIPHARPPQILLTDGTETDRDDIEKVAVKNFNDSGTWSAGDRIPVDQPIDIDGFKRATELEPQHIPKTSSLSVGYLVQMEQLWLPAGYSLGDLIYSLPLAPGEQQRIAVFEQTETIAEQEAEGTEFSQTQTFNEASDSSSIAVFNSALRTAAFGGSSFRTSSESSAAGDSGGFLGAIFGGGNSSTGHTSSSGEASSFQTGSKTFVSRAAEELHSNLGRVASDTRRSKRTRVRTATATDLERITTKVIGNNNHCHALTVQFWEVLRHFSVSSRVKDAQLVCFVPVGLIGFLPHGQNSRLPDVAAGAAPSRTVLLARYEALIRYREAILTELGNDRAARYAYSVLEGLLSNPQMTVGSGATTALTSVSITVDGNFAPGEEVSVSMVTRAGNVYGPVRLPVPTPAHAGTPQTEAELIQDLLGHRAGGPTSVSVDLGALPANLLAGDIAGFTVTRAFRRNAMYVDTLVGAAGVTTQQVKFLSPAAHEDLLGPLTVSSFKANLGSNVGPQVANAAGLGPLHSSLTIPAQVPSGPSVSIDDVLQVERLLQFVLRQTVRFSKAVWAYLTPEERAMLLEPYTVEFFQPPAAAGGTPINIQVPLLQCVSNTLLGFLGNSLIFPFFIPAEIENQADLEDGGVKLSSKRLHDLLLEFHQQNFVPPRTTVTLPTRGMLGEAMLGSCNSCEKIDLTRFWNWSDSPIPTASDPNQNLFKGNQLVSASPAASPLAPGVVPAAVSPPGSQVNITAPATTPASSLTDLLKTALTSTGSDTAKDMTLGQLLETLQGKTIDSAEGARKDALAQSNALAKEILDRLTDIIKSGNETAAKVAPAAIAAACWVAREVYGEENPRWKLFRAWLLADAPVWFRNLYLNHGERFARWIAPYPLLKAVIREWMDSRIERNQGGIHGRQALPVL